MYKLVHRIVTFLRGVPRIVWIGLVVIPLVGVLVNVARLMIPDHPFATAAPTDVVTTGDRFGDALTSEPEYLRQGWDEADIQWFYNTTQGSALLPYSFFLALEQPSSGAGPDCERAGVGSGPWFLCDDNIDRYRYLPQTASEWNPDALPVGFVKEPYGGMDYVGYTCAACHTGQVNFEGRALRIEGGPAMADMDGFLRRLTLAMQETLPTDNGDTARFDRFADRVMELDDRFDDREAVQAELELWTGKRDLYNQVNYSLHDGRKLDYGYARLDAFGRIYNRVLQHMLKKSQLADRLATAVDPATNQTFLDRSQIDRVLAFIPDDNLVMSDRQFLQVIENLRSDQDGMPGLGDRQMTWVQLAVFNSPNAPVSYPFLWDITHSDYVQWNGLAGNSALGPLGRNAGEVIGVFAILDWKEDTGLFTRLFNFSLSSWLSGQSTKRRAVSFDSSVDMFNLQRIESRLRTLTSPRWPFCRRAGTEEFYLPEGPKDLPVDERPCADGDTKLDADKVAKGRILYKDCCESCHQILDPTDWDRIMVSEMLSIEKPESTDHATAHNSVHYTGPSGNFANNYQSVTGVGDVVIADEAPIVQVLTAATKGVIGAGDPDSNFLDFLAERVITIGMALRDNPIKASVKSGDYMPDTTANPYNSLLAYRGRSLNGIWATAPYLHNGSVPSLYDLLLPEKAAQIPGAPAGTFCDETRPTRFRVGSREFDPRTVGFLDEGYAGGSMFDTTRRGNRNHGHEYGACGMTEAERWALIEYLKSL